MRRLKSGRTPNSVGNDQRGQKNASALQARLEEEGKYRLNQEIATGETWIDGRTIHRYVIQIDAFPNATTTTYPVTRVDREIVRAYGVARLGSVTIPIPYVDGNTGNRIGLLISASGVRVRTGGNFSGYSGYVVLEYTK